jgi:hypothetical protein
MLQNLNVVVEIGIVFQDDILLRSSKKQTSEPASEIKINGRFEHYSFLTSNVNVDEA